ncbi:hypothetical protein P168DRAFT_299395 [Aspergillus campestris IBT 28561]|uniref:Mediator of RNA polymerase II transcription subunit 4 n=1 Tax=Aspergillus campestris (strain IBT 28561) TaxID=1392248 RepID=A0A2I1CTS7_ASPC2|nr:uncharacterized protein P168DRAFT_299395 [Aspergillus campestris IBT 28561]PKY01036.1 hypothetical protein P168DRAFT_299395 [Aspergillus campestris IBT 28561]
MDAQFQSTLSNLENKLNALISSLTTSPTAAGAPAAALNLLEADDALTSDIETLRQHQENYARILKLREESASLEEKVKDIVREVVRHEKDIQTACGGDVYDSDDSSDYEDDVSGAPGKPARGRTMREIDYKLLLDFARRISNHGGAGATGTEEGVAPVASVTKDATSWLDESANMTRQVYMLPYPMEDRIRMGLMGQIQLASGEGRPDFDADKEVERLIREAEGLGTAGAVPPAAEMGEATRHAEEAAKAAAHAGVAATSGRAAVAAAPAPKPKAMLDLDLYDPDEDDE